MKTKTHANTVSNKRVFYQTLAFVKMPFCGDEMIMEASAAYFIIEWLHDMNWHPEAQAIEARVASERFLSGAFAKLEADEKATRRIHDAASLLNHLCGWGLSPDEWQATEGEQLVEELWALIVCGIPEGAMECDYAFRGTAKKQKAEVDNLTSL